MAAAKPKAKSEAELKTEPAIVVRSIPESFWRARRQFTQEEQTLLLRDLSGTDLNEIEGEPLLVVQRIEVEVQPELDVETGAEGTANQGSAT